MALHLTSKGVLGKIGRATEQSKSIRSGVLCSSAGAAGLAMGKTEQLGTNVPAITTAAGVGISMLGLSAFGDGVAASGATLLGYQLGSRKEKEKTVVLRKRVVVRR